MEFGETKPNIEKAMPDDFFKSFNKIDAIDAPNKHVESLVGDLTDKVLQMQHDFNLVSDCVIEHSEQIASLESRLEDRPLFNTLVEHEMPVEFISTKEFYLKYKFISAGFLSTVIRKNKYFNEKYKIVKSMVYVDPITVLMFFETHKKKHPLVQKAYKNWQYYIESLECLAKEAKARIKEGK